MAEVRSDPCRTESQPTIKPGEEVQAEQRRRAFSTEQDGDQLLHLVTAESDPFGHHHFLRPVAWRHWVQSLRALVDVGDSESEDLTELLVTGTEVVLAA